MSAGEFWEITLSEFDRRCQGYHRRELARLQRLRLVLAEVRNGLRHPEAEAQTAAEILPLPGDEALAGSQLTEAEYLAELGRLADLDKDLL
jgi:hypothetical protein